MGSWTNIAALLSAKTKEGGLSVKPTEGLPFLLTEGLEVTFVPPLLRFPRSSKVKRVENPSPGKYLVYFEDIDSRNDAELLEGHFCLVRNSDLPENFDISDDRMIVGFAVCDEAQGFLGRVVRIEENPAHPLLVVMREEDASSIQGQTFEDQTNLQDSDNNNEAYTEVLIPLVDAFVVDIDENACVIKVSLPDGLLDL